MSAVLEIKDVRFGYDNSKTVLNGIGVSIEKGELLCILGANGCGKSTLMETIIGLNTRYSGSIKINGKDLHNYNEQELAQNIAIVFQDSEMPFSFSVEEVVLMGRTPYISNFGSPKKSDILKVREAMEIAEITHLKDKIFTNLSGGEQQMVLIARALAQDTDIILMDEPTSHLDFRNQAKVMKTAYQLSQDRNVAIVMTTHSPQQTMLYPCKCALMYNGGFLVSGKSREVITQENLSAIYNMDIHVKKFYDEKEQREYTICEPVT